MYTASSCRADFSGQVDESKGKDTFWFIPHTHWEGAVFKTREKYLEMGLPHILSALRLLRADPDYRFVLDQVCYVKTTIFRDVAAPAYLEFGVDDGSKVWLNGRLIHADATGGAAAPGEHRVDVDLKKGANELLMKITQISGPWQFCMSASGRDDPLPENKAVTFSPAGDWTTLFDGKSLGGWKQTGYGIFKIEEGLKF